MKNSSETFLFKSDDKIFINSGQLLMSDKNIIYILFFIFIYLYNTFHPFLI